ncbi:MAG: PAS domain S-box protein, partial [Promethearchaeota archaeon]
MAERQPPDEGDLQEIQLNLESLFNSLQDLIFVLNSEGHIIYVNKKVVETLGYLEEELLNVPISNVHPPDRREEVELVVKEILEGKRDLCPIPLITKDGKLLPVETKVKRGKWSNQDVIFGISRDITERKDIEKQLEESEKKFRRIFEAIPDLFFLISREGIFLDYRTKELNLYQPPEKFLGKKIEDVLPKDLAESILENIKRTLETKQPNIIEYSLHIEGTIRHFEARHFFFSKDQVAVFIRDITERKHAEEALRESEEKYKTVFDSSINGIAISTLDGKLIDANHAYLDILGYSLEELKNMDIQQLTPKKSHELEAEAMKNFMVEGYRVFEKEYIKKDGTTFPVSITGWLIKDELGNPVRLGAFIKDLSDRKLYEESEKRFKSLFKGVAVPSYTWQKVGNEFMLIDYNIAADKFTHGNVKNFVGSKASEMYAERPDIREDLNRCFNEKSVFTREMKYHINILKRDVDQITTYSFIPPDFVLVQAEDITERKKSERKLVKSEKKYREAFNRAEFYKDLFAHDINNILQSVLSAMELCGLVLDKPDNQAKLIEYLNVIKNQINRGSKLVSNIRTLSKLEQEERTLEKIEILSILNKSIELIRDSYQNRKINIQIDSFSKEVHIIANNLIQDVFENIIINAMRHNTNSTVEISIKISKTIKDSVDYIKIEFLDNGRGILDDMKEKIFQRSDKDAKSVSGMGLGLSLVKKIITSYNGH